MTDFDHDSTLALIASGDYDTPFNVLQDLDVSDLESDKGNIAECVEALIDADPFYSQIAPPGVIYNGRESEDIKDYIQRVASTYLNRVIVLGSAGAMALEMSTALEIIDPSRAGYNASGDFPEVGKYDAALMVTCGGPTVHILANNIGTSTHVAFYGSWGTGVAVARLYDTDASYLVESCEQWAECAQGDDNYMPRGY